MHELDVKQRFEEATPYQVRDELQDLPLGPWEGDLEVLSEKVPGPGDRYLVGRLGPKRAHDQDDSSGTGADITTEGDGQDPELPDKLTIQDAGRMWASSMGLSCHAAEGVTTLNVTTEWGRYRKADVLDVAGNRKSRWSGEPVSIDSPIDDPYETDFDGDAEEKHLRLLYRDALKHAASRNVATQATIRPSDRKAYKIETEWLPAFTFANHAMLLQRQHTTIAGLRDEMNYDQAKAAVDAQGAKIAT